MAGDFFERMQALSDDVGDGDLVGSVSFHTVYAWNQHEMRWINFMGRYGPKPILHYHHGGGEKYLERPFFANASGYMQHLADAVFLPNGLHSAMETNMKELAGESAEAAPIDSGDLRASVEFDVSG